MSSEERVLGIKKGYSCRVCNKPLDILSYTYYMGFCEEHYKEETEKRKPLTERYKESKSQTT